MGVANFRDFWDKKILLRLTFMLERIEIEMFAEDKCILNELLVAKIVFQCV